MRWAISMKAGATTSRLLTRPSSHGSREPLGERSAQGAACTHGRAALGSRHAANGMEVAGGNVLFVRDRRWGTRRHGREGAGEALDVRRGRGEAGTHPNGPGDGTAGSPP